MTFFRTIIFGGRITSTVLMLCCPGVQMSNNFGWEKPFILHDGKTTRLKNHALFDCPSGDVTCFESDHFIAKASSVKVAFLPGDACCRKEKNSMHTHALVGGSRYSNFRMNRMNSILCLNFI